MTFEWDEAKNRANLRKHGLDFESARVVFSDPLALLPPNPGSHGEERWRIIGRIGEHSSPSSSSRSRAKTPKSIASFRPGGQPPTRGKLMKRVEGFGDLSPDQKERLARLAARPESEIDTSDIPEWTDADFAAAIRLQGRPLAEVLRLYRTRKAPITARIDLDVLEWLKSKGEGYQTRLNAILRDAMAQELAAGTHKARPASGKPKSPAAKHPKAARPQPSHAPAVKKAAAGTAQKAKASKSGPAKGKKAQGTKAAKRRRPSPLRQKAGSTQEP